MNKRPLTLAQAQAQYVHRFTMDHFPAWARQPAPNGRYPAPQFRSDREWYENTLFPGEGFIGRRSRHCFTSNLTWPLGRTLDKPFRR